MEKGLLHFYRNTLSGELVVSMIAKEHPDYKELHIYDEKDADAKHVPNIEWFDEMILMTIGQVLHKNNLNCHIEKVVLQQGEFRKEWDTSQQASRGFPTVIRLFHHEAPKGKADIYVCCSSEGVFHSTALFPQKSKPFPAVMFWNENSALFVVRFPDLPTVVGAAKTKEEAHEQAKAELRMALLCSEYMNVEPSELNQVRQTHPNAFMMEV